jgi:hypothetical protein
MAAMPIGMAIIEVVLLLLLMVMVREGELLEKLVVMTDHRRFPARTKIRQNMKKWRGTII